MNVIEISVGVLAILVIASVAMIFKGISWLDTIIHPDIEASHSDTNYP